MKAIALHRTHAEMVEIEGGMLQHVEFYRIALYEAVLDDWGQELIWQFNRWLGNPVRHAWAVDFARDYANSENATNMGEQGAMNGNRVESPSAHFLAAVMRAQQSKVKSDRSIKLRPKPLYRKLTRRGAVRKKRW